MQSSANPSLFEFIKGLVRQAAHVDWAEIGNGLWVMPYLYIYLYIYVFSIAVPCPIPIAKVCILMTEVVTPTATPAQFRFLPVAKPPSLTHNHHPCPCPVLKKTVRRCPTPPAWPKLQGEWPAMQHSSTHRRKSHHHSHVEYLSMYLSIILSI